MLKPAVCVVIQRHDGRLLMLRRATGRPAAGYWTPVAGKMEPGESFEDAARREVQEEVGLAIGPPGPVIGHTPTERPPAEGGGSAGFELTWFLVRLPAERDPDADALRLAPREVAEARWVTAREAALLEPMFGATRLLLARLFAGAFPAA